MSLTVAVSNLGRVAWNRTAKQWRQWRQRIRRRWKATRETGKAARAAARASAAQARDARTHAYAGSVRTVRYWSRVGRQTVPRIRRELAVRRELRRIAAGSGPILVGPWLSEVGYEVLYWVPFLRWFTDRYGVDRSRLVVVSRGGVAGWYADVADGYVELLDLYDPAEFARRNAERQQAGEQKQHGVAGFDAEIVEAVRQRPGLAGAAVCHPSLMFRLLRQFWLGNEAVSYVQEYTRITRVSPPYEGPLPPLPDRYTAVKLYSGKAIPDTPGHRRALRALVEQAAAQTPVVVLDTNLALDDHADFLFRDVPNVTTLDGWLTPQNNLGLQTAVVRGASRFVSTCGGLAWLAPLMGVETVAVYADDELLTPHLYAARLAFRASGAAPFVPLHLGLAEIAGPESPAGGHDTPRS
jgi:hypothetical protein